jgi:hypothetical protein
MTHRTLFDVFDQALCISLPRCLERRAHIRAEFARVGLTRYRFIDAFDRDSDEVRERFASDFVHKYPPCFRCGRNECACENKSLFPAQIGNWLSHMAAWREVREQRAARLTLVCEDDVKFRDTIHDCLALVGDSAAIEGQLEAERPVLIRLGWGLCDDHAQSASPYLTQDIRMANPCYAINRALAGLLLDSLDGIHTTSDIYVHRIIGSGVAHYTVMPPAAYELSWSTAELRSEIRPKQKYVDRLKKQQQAADEGSTEFVRMQELIADEERRIEDFATFNQDPARKTPGNDN